MTYEPVADLYMIGAWRVEYIDYDEGLCYVIIFSGPEAEARAREYADWKNTA